jgi:predicted RNA-binding Zn-ribbon protein involved in translation (DUF1610 family)
VPSGSIQFRWYDAWRHTPLTCSGCGWRGLLDPRHLEAFGELAHFECPECEKILAIVSYPTRAETTEAARSGHPEAASELARLRELGGAGDHPPVGS